MLQIDRHRLVGPQVFFRATPNVGGVLQPQYLVVHYTAGSSAQSAIESLCTRKPRGNASAHMVLARDGTITQLAPFNQVTWHAGDSHWSGLEGLNEYSIGIEIDNAGPLNPVGGQNVSWFGKAYPDNEVMLAAHKHGGGMKPWHAYTAVQIERCLELAELLVEHYQLKDVIGHDDIARGRKLDPGPAFPLAAIASRALGRGDTRAERYVIVVDAANTRSGPGTEFPTTAPALKKGTVVMMLEPGDRWSHIEVEGASEVDGWVHNSLMTRLSEAPRSLVPPAQRAAARAPKTAFKTPRKTPPPTPTRRAPATRARG